MAGLFLEVAFLPKTIPEASVPQVSVRPLLQRAMIVSSSHVRIPSTADVRDNAMWQMAKPVVTGALSGMTAVCCTQPLDSLKVRVQVAAAVGKNASPFTIASETFRNECPFVLYKGLSAGLMRQVIYTGGRFGLFDSLMEQSQDARFDSLPGFAKKSFCALTAGGLAAAAANPADLSSGCRRTLCCRRLSGETTAMFFMPSLPLQRLRARKGFSRELLQRQREQWPRPLARLHSMHKQKRCCRKPALPNPCR